MLPKIMEIEAAPLVSDLHTEAWNNVLTEVKSRTRTLHLMGSNEAARSLVVSSFLIGVTSLFEEDLYLAAQKNLSGRRGNGPVEYSVHSRKSMDCCVSVTEVKKENFKQGVAQNIVQLESALTAKKRSGIVMRLMEKKKIRQAN
ncbi:hypothetical protein BGZ76_004324 [Entomortierella beljakovae]|nr:hypothetical protein BGZ76_004324 [Entomortierella beljakovae]